MTFRLVLFVLISIISPYTEICRGSQSSPQVAPTVSSTSSVTLALNKYTAHQTLSNDDIITLKIAGFTLRQIPESLKNNVELCTAVQLFNAINTTTNITLQPIHVALLHTHDMLIINTHNAKSSESVISATFVGSSIAAFNAICLVSAKYDALKKLSALPCDAYSVIKNSIGLDSQQIPSVCKYPDNALALSHAEYEKSKKALIVGVSVAGSTLVIGAAYGAYCYFKNHGGITAWYKKHIQS